MTIFQMMKNLIQRKNPPIDIWYYIQGMYRYKLYYSKYKYLIRDHILEQIEARINTMDKECYNAGFCKHCGCMVTALQMSNKQCHGKEYPVMMNKEHWKRFKKGMVFLFKKQDELWRYDRLNHIFKPIYNKNLSHV